MDLDAVVSEIASGLSFLRKCGYSDPNASRTQSELLGPGVDVVFDAPQLQRSVDISYTPRQDAQRAALVILLCSGDRYFAVGDWAAAKHVVTALSHTQESGAKSEEAFIRDMCQEFRLLAQGPLKEIVEGKAWEEIPMNWGIYR